jgi:hypothetical protein
LKRNPGREPRRIRASKYLHFEPKRSRNYPELLEISNDGMEIKIGTIFTGML